MYATCLLNVIMLGPGGAEIPALEMYSLAKRIKSGSPYPFPSLLKSSFPFSFSVQTSNLSSQALGCPSGCSQKGGIINTSWNELKSVAGSTEVKNASSFEVRQSQVWILISYETWSKSSCLPWASLFPSVYWVCTGLLYRVTMSIAWDNAGGRLNIFAITLFLVIMKYNQHSGRPQRMWLIWLG